MSLSEFGIVDFVASNRIYTIYLYYFLYTTCTKKGFLEQNFPISPVSKIQRFLLAEYEIMKIIYNNMNYVIYEVKCYIVFVCFQ